VLQPEAAREGIDQFRLTAAFGDPPGLFAMAALDEVNGACRLPQQLRYTHAGSLTRYATAQSLTRLPAFELQDPAPVLPV
jgi:hypothetical protein